MKALDFEYDGVELSSLGYFICTFDRSSGVTTSNPGGEIEFSTVTMRNTNVDAIASTKYTSALQATFSICKDVESGDDAEISVTELRQLMTWLNRKQFCQFRFLETEWQNIYFEASFNVARCEIGGVLIGLELTMTTNRPYGLGSPITVTHTITSSNQQFTITNQSDEIGFTFPESVKIKCSSGGNLDLSNSQDGRHTYIANCSANETITMDSEHQIIATDNGGHTALANDFNYYFFRLSRTYTDRDNVITVSIPCEITIVYRPIIKAFI